MRRESSGRYGNLPSGTEILEMAVRGKFVMCRARFYSRPVMRRESSGRYGDLPSGTEILEMAVGVEIR